MARKFSEQMKIANEAGDTKAWNKYAKGLKQTQNAMRQVTKESFDLEKILDNLSGTTMYNLNKAQKEIERQMNKGVVKRNSEEWHAYKKQLQAVKDEKKRLNKEVLIGESVWQKFTSTIKSSITSVTTMLLSVTGLMYAMKRSAEEAARMSDVYANVRKYTGESAEGVEELNEELKKMDTRTSREELNRLLGEAGKLGITGKENLIGFARAADVIQVALGDDLGEDAVKSMGKLAEMFGLVQDMGIEKSMLKVASVINELAQNSTASEPI
jgi:hypothetical protein